MRYTDKEVGSYTVNGEERVVVERTFTDGTVHHHFVRESNCEHCERGRIYINDTLYFCEDCDGRGHASEDVPCDPFGNDEDSDLYLPYVNARTETAMLDLFHRIDPSDLAMDSFG